MIHYSVITWNIHLLKKKKTQNHSMLVERKRNQFNRPINFSLKTPTKNYRSFLQVQFIG